MSQKLSYKKRINAEFIVAAYTDALRIHGVEHARLIEEANTNINWDQVKEKINQAAQQTRRDLFWDAISYPVTKGN